MTRRTPRHFSSIRASSRRPSTRTFRRATTVRHVFVESAPDRLDEGTIYVSIPFATVLHRCCCGCGQEVVTPLTPTDWTLRFDGETISLDPSIGNWSLPCRSHYWILKNRVEWAGEWSQERIGAGRARDRTAKAQYFTARAEGPIAEPKAGFWRKFFDWWQRKLR